MWPQSHRASLFNVQVCKVVLLLSACGKPRDSSTEPDSDKPMTSLSTAGVPVPVLLAKPDHDHGRRRRIPESMLVAQVIIWNPAMSFSVSMVAVAAVDSSC